MQDDEPRETTSAGSYAFILNIRQLDDEGAPHVLAPGHELRRATQAEIADIDSRLAGLMSGPFGFVERELWRERWSLPGSPERLPEAEWRYFIVAFKGGNRVMVDLELAFHIAPIELQVGFYVLSDVLMVGGVGFGLNEAHLFHFLQAARFRGPDLVDVVAEDVKAIAEVYSRLKAHDSSLVNVAQLAGRVRELKRHPLDSPLRFLGYFAILESLLTHPPQRTDPYDSITRQVQNKIALLDHRWDQRLDYTGFRGATPETIWRKLYRYRSLVAHGGAATFTVDHQFTGELDALGDHERALRLVRETVKAVIRQALVEPQLLVDLREC